MTIIKKSLLIIATVILPFIFNACSGDDEFYNTEPEKDLKIVSSPTVIPAPSGGYYDYTITPCYIFNHVDISNYNIDWLTSDPRVAMGYPRVVVIHTKDQFQSTFRGTNLVSIDFSKCIVVASQFYTKSIVQKIDKYFYDYTRHSQYNPSTSPTHKIDLRVTTSSWGTTPINDFYTSIIVVPRTSASTQFCGVNLRFN